ncbi:MAG: FKBP-type peptidyl-prolyl cis-trans isomerase [Quisquiliibacterium sp.]
MLIDDDTWVTVRYRLFDSQGEEIDPVERELTYLHGGYGAVFAQIEQALQGHPVGFGTSVYLQPEDSFGDYDAELVQLVPRDALPAELEIGMSFEGVPGESGDDEDEQRIYIVTDMAEGVVVLDANHPLAGMALRFDLQVVDLRVATDEEIENERAQAGEEDDEHMLIRPVRSHLRHDGDEPFDDEPESPLGPSRRLH